MVCLFLLFRLGFFGQCVPRKRGGVSATASREQPQITTQQCRSTELNDENFATAINLGIAHLSNSFPNFPTPSISERTTLEGKEHRSAYSKHSHCENETMDQVSDLEEIILDSLGPQSPPALWRLRNGLKEWHKTNFILSLPQKDGICKAYRKKRIEIVCSSCV